LNDPEWSLWSDREIARRCAVSHTFIANLRPTVTGNVASEDRLYQTKHGTITSMTTSAIGRMEPRIIPFDEHQAREHLAAAKVINAGKWEERRAAAIARTNSVEFKALELGQFAVIYADPPWRYENPPIGSPSRRIENHYPTMLLDEICALPVAEIAHENSVLFLWATAPKLYECMRVIDAWGFEYRTGMVWAKDKIGMGYYVRNQHEHLLICKRGEMPHPPESARCSSLIEAPRLEHSSKPEIYDHRRDVPRSS
jgi:N6-adenosine-specific RNA methylase IME4